MPKNESSDECGIEVNGERLVATSRIAMFGQSANHIVYTIQARTRTDKQ